MTPHMQNPTSKGPRRRPVVGVLVGIILLTIPCYLIGFAALFILQQNNPILIAPAITATPALIPTQPLPATPTLGALLPTQPALPTVTLPALPTATVALPTATLTAVPIIEPTPLPSPTLTAVPTLAATAPPTPIP